MTRRIIAVVDDMLFAAKIRGTAEGAGVAIHFARNISKVCQLAIAEPVSLIIVDLHTQCCDPFALAEHLVSDEHFKTIPLLGFFSHVQVALGKRAEEVGYGRVLTRSVFSNNLPLILTGEF